MDKLVADYRNMGALYEPQNGIPSTRRRGINSVETGIRVLTAVMELGRASSLKAIAEKVDMDSSQVYRYVSSLVNSRMLIQDAGSSYYDLGPLALKIGLSAMARLDELVVIENGIKEFSRLHDATVMLTVWGSGGPTVIRWFQGRPPVFTTLAVGSLLPLTSSATGHVFLAMLDESLLQNVLISEDAKLPIADDPKLAAIRSNVLRTRAASIDSHFIPGLRAHAVPILGIQNTLLGVATIIANDAVLEGDFDVLKVKLLDCCQLLTSDLGGVW
jgi:DNA-binding IclR family transcriptional regulator